MCKALACRPIALVGVGEVREVEDRVHQLVANGPKTCDEHVVDEGEGRNRDRGGEGAELDGGVPRRFSRNCSREGPGSRPVVSVAEAAAEGPLMCTACRGRALGGDVDVPESDVWDRLSRCGARDRPGSRPEASMSVAVDVACCRPRLVGGVGPCWSGVTGTVS